MLTCKVYVKRGWDKNRGLTMLEAFVQAKSVLAAKSAAVAIFRARGDGFHDRLVLVQREGERSIARWECHPGREGTVSWTQTTPTAWKPRGVCPECRGVFALTTRGTLTPHRRADGRTVRTLQGARVPAPCDGAAHTPTVVE